MEREPRLGFYRAALVIEAAGVEAKSSVAAHRATAIVEQATHSPVLRRFPQRHQAAALIDQPAGRKPEALRLDGAVTVIQCACQGETALTVTGLRPGSLLVEQAVSIDRPAPGLDPGLLRIHISLRAHGQLTAVYGGLAQGHAALAGRQRGAAGRNLRAADIHPPPGRVDVLFTEQTATGADIALAIKLQIGIMDQRAFGITARQQVAAALDAARGVQVHIPGRRQRTGLRQHSLATLYGQLPTAVHFAVRLDVAFCRQLNIAASLGGRIRRIRAPTELAFAAHGERFARPDLSALVTHADAGFGADHADTTAVHATHLPHVDGKLRPGTAVVRKRRGGFAVRAHAVTTGHQRHAFFSPDAGVDLHRACQNVDVLGIMTGIAVEPTALDAHHAALDLVARHAAIGVQLRFAGGQRHAPSVDGAAAVADNAGGVGHNHLRLAAGHFHKTAQLAGIVAVDFVEDDASRRGIGIEIRVTLDHPGHLGRGHHRRVVEDGAFGVDVELLILIM
ncbi:Uncharacterised protein [Serratia marcescens]|nr:Uncharacterised protein [Serratia marcescens]